MVRTYKRLTRAVDRDSVVQAWKSVNEEGWTQREAAEVYDVPRSTLQRYLKKEIDEIPDKISSGRFKTVFTAEQEKQLVDHLIELSLR